MRIHIILADLSTCTCSKKWYFMTANDMEPISSHMCRNCCYCLLYILWYLYSSPSSVCQRMECAYMYCSRGNFYFSPSSLAVLLFLFDSSSSSSSSSSFSVVLMHHTRLMPFTVCVIVSVVQWVQLCKHGNRAAVNASSVLHSFMICSCV